MRKLIFLVPAAVFLLAQAAAFAAAPALTNKAQWTWEDIYSRPLGGSFTVVTTNYFKFVVIQGAAVNPVPLPGETIRIPFTVQNVGSMAMTAPLLLAASFPSAWGTATITTDAGTAKVIDVGDDTNKVISQVGALASGAFSYYWLNIQAATNLPEGAYGYVLTNSCSSPFPLVVRYSNSFNSYMQTVTVMSASDGARKVTNFNGTGLLGDLDVGVTVRFFNPPATAWLYFDVDAVPNGSAPNGTITKNRRVPLTRHGTNWIAKIPVSDPEIRDGKQVNFIIVADGRKFFYSSGSIPYSYFVKQYASQPQETDKPVLIANNVGDFGQKPARLVYTLTRNGFVNISVYDIRGAVIRGVKNQATDAGRYVDQWDGRNDSGDDVAEGLYFIHIETPEFGVTFKLLLVRR